MGTTIDVMRSAPGVLEALRGPREYLLRDSELEPTLLLMVQAYVANLDGCAACKAGFATEARRAGVDDQRMRLLPFWREAPVRAFSVREKAAFAWAEAVVNLDREGDWEGLRRHARAHFSEREFAEVTLAAVSTHGWSRMVVSLGDTRPFAPAAASRDLAAGATATDCVLCGIA